MTRAFFSDTPGTLLSMMRSIFRRVKLAFFWAFTTAEYSTGRLSTASAVTTLAFVRDRLDQFRRLLYGLAGHGA